MDNSNTLVVDSIIQRLQIKEITILIAASILLQFVIHFIPQVNGIPLGAILLPMFYVPLIAVTFYKFQTALVVTAFGPILNYLITGNPRLETVPLLTFEVLLFVLMLTVFLRYNKLIRAGTLISILTALTVSPLVFGIFNSSGFSALHLLTSLQNAVPGMIIIVLVNILLLRLKKRL